MGGMKPRSMLDKKSKKRPALVRRSRKTQTLQPVPIVGIGASAGGLEAFGNLIESLPLKTGMAYVLIQHLDPLHKSMLVELLARFTQIPVTEVKNGTLVTSDHIYVIPPGKCMTLKGERLMLLSRPKEKGLLNMPIDDFFISLVSERQEKAIGVVLSGTASDGTVGLRAIKEAGGLTFAQDTTAKYQSMPQSAISASVVDYVLSPQRIAEELALLSEHPLVTMGDSELSKTELHKLDDYRRIIAELLRATGVDFSHYKETTLTRRITRRMIINKMETAADYLNFLRGNGTEADALFNDILIHVTDFFRDPVALNTLTQKLLPKLIKAKTAKEPLRIWVAGCATGEEVYSLAITVLDFMSSKSLSIPLQIFGTDLAQVAIAKARHGTYTKSDVIGVSPQRLERYFVETNGAYQIRRDVRDMCVFSLHNLLKDPPFSRIDIVSCCNVLIYMDTSLQYRILSALHYALVSEGVLILGKSESVGVTPKLFIPVVKKSKVFTKKTGTRKVLPDVIPREERAMGRQRTPSSRETTPLARTIGIQDEADAILVGRFAPASVLVNAEYEILQFRGDTGEYLQFPTGKATFNLLKVARAGLISELRGAILKAKRTSLSIKREVTLLTETHAHAISIEVIPLNKTSAERHFLVIFHTAPERVDTADSPLRQTASNVRRSKTESRRSAVLEKELAQVRDNERSLAEEQEAAVEELQSANEEILSSNEELQSINEELETSGEELESTNEELNTINQELQTRNEQLNESRAYTEAIIETVRGSLIVINSDLRVRSANESFFRTFQVSKEQTEGNFLYELGNGQWDIPKLRTLLTEILPKNTKLENFEIEHTFPSIGHKVLLLNARKLIQDAGKTGLILLAIEDITEQALAHQKIIENEERYRILFDLGPIALYSCDANGVIRDFNHNATELWGRSPQRGDTDERFWGSFKLYRSDGTFMPHEVTPMAEVLSGKIPEARDLEVQIARPDGSRVTVIINIRPIKNEKEEITGAINCFVDITGRKELEQQKEEFIGIASHEIKTPVTTIKTFTELLQKKLSGSVKKESAVILEHIITQSDRLTNLVGDLLSFSQMQAGKFLINKEEFDLNKLMERTVSAIKETTLHHTITLEGRVKRHVVADASRIEQVVINLLTNAIKYSPVGKKVIVHVGEHAGDAVVSIQDFGLGIEKADHKTIFERFYRGKEKNGFAKSEKAEGFGLGLFIAAQIIEKHEGKILVESILGKGSTFTFTLPLPQLTKRKATANS